MCCLFCFITDQQLDATACETGRLVKMRTREFNRYPVGFEATSPARHVSSRPPRVIKSNAPHRFLKGAVEPAVVDHVLDGDRWILQVLKGVHQDEVQHYVIEVQVLHLRRRRIWILERKMIHSLRNQMVRSQTRNRREKKKRQSPRVWPAPPLCFPSVPCAPGRKASPRTLPQICSDSENQTLTVRGRKHSLRVSPHIIPQRRRRSYLLCFNDNRRQYFLSCFGQKHPGCSLAQNELQNKKQQKTTSTICWKD